jgi:hypothetical protein
MLAEPGSALLSAGMQQVADRPFGLNEWAGGTREAIAKPFTIQNIDTIELELTPSGPSGPPPTITGMAITAQ